MSDFWSDPLSTSILHLCKQWRLSARMCRLSCLCVKYHNLMSWFIYGEHRVCLDLQNWTVSWKGLKLLRTLRVFFLFTKAISCSKKASATLFALIFDNSIWHYRYIQTVYTLIRLFLKMVELYLLYVWPCVISYDFSVKSVSDTEDTETVFDPQWIFTGLFITELSA